MDRIDIQIEIVPVTFEKMSGQERGESSASIRERVIHARQIQTERFAHIPNVHCNAQMTSKLLHQYAQPDTHGLELLRNAMNRLADLDGSPQIQTGHLAEAISYRNLDRENWAG